MAELAAGSECPTFYVAEQRRAYRRCIRAFRSFLATRIARIHSDATEGTALSAEVGSAHF